MINNSSINRHVSDWEIELENDKDKVFLIDGIKNGFRIIDKDSQVTKVEQKNSKSALKYKEAVDKELIDQINKGHYIIASKKPSIISAIAAIPKNDNEIRLIHDGSRPVGRSMNDYSIPERFKFQTIEDACRLAKPGYWCAKVDLQAAYRSVCIHPDDYDVTGLKWTFKDDKDPTYLFDCRLPFGSNVGPSHFNRISQAVRRCMLRRGYVGVIAYIDDFLLTAPTEKECEEMLLTLIRILRKLGFNISWKKVVGPTQHITFLGVDIDTQTRTLSLGPDKIKKLLNKLELFQHRKRASKQQLQSLAGSLNWATFCIRGGKFFLRRILDAQKNLKHKHHKAKLTKAFHADLQWWISFLIVFNGTVYLNDMSTQHVYVDACNKAAGAFYNGDWLYTVFEKDIPAADKLHINFKEVLSIVQAVKRWGFLWEGKDVIFHTDSTVTKGIINKGRSTNEYINALLRKMAWDCAKRNCRIKAVHISGAVNIKADVISRLHEGRLLELLTLLYYYHRNRLPNINLRDHMSKPAFCFLCDRV